MNLQIRKTILLSNRQYVDKLLISLLLVLLSIVSYGQSNDSELANEYYLNGESSKAIAIYEKLATKKQEIPIIHNNYLALLLQQAQYQSARKYLTRVNKYFPSNINYQVDLLWLYHLSDQKSYQSYYEIVKGQYNTNQFQLSQIAQKLTTKKLDSQALELYQLARSASGNPRAYALEIASIYRTLELKQQMVAEYLNYGLINSKNTNYVKNLFQTLLTEEDDFNQLKELLLVQVQRNPDEEVYVDLLIWVQLQQKDFYGAFIQARALDRRNGKPGDECMRIAQIATSNKSWEDAIEIYQYVTQTYPNQYHAPNARQQLIDVKRQKILNDRPIDTIKLKQLVSEYDILIADLPQSKVALESSIQKAKILAFYLDQRQNAIEVLLTLVGNRAVPKKLVDESKLILGDIYMLDDQSWEAALLYAQVQKDNPYDQVGYDARLRNARLYYFEGEFALANSYLKILKRATTKKISNDAMGLGLLISNNTVLDTTDQIMMEFAHIEKSLYQNRADSAIQELKRFIELYPTHSLADEALWLIANTYLDQDDYEASLEALSQIQDKYASDILGDDAAYLIATITEEKLRDQISSQELYRTFITAYPGSLYVSEARKRFRRLRGDIVN
ncbi:MAG: tetratricopeptide (TPR) repeat protein [Cyclobacteriaceae bacterium]|jgi:tetratricopeptide (TPR) repeat protein